VGSTARIDPPWEQHEVSDGNGGGAEVPPVGDAGVHTPSHVSVVEVDAHEMSATRDRQREVTEDPHVGDEATDRRDLPSDLALGKRKGVEMRFERGTVRVLGQRVDAHHEKLVDDRELAVEVRPRPVGRGVVRPPDRAIAATEGQEPTRA